LSGTGTKIGFEFAEVQNFVRYVNIAPELILLHLELGSLPFVISFHFQIRDEEEIASSVIDMQDTTEIFIRCRNIEWIKGEGERVDHELTTEDIRTFQRIVRINEEPCFRMIRFPHERLLMNEPDPLSDRHCPEMCLIECLERRYEWRIINGEKFAWSRK